MSGAEGRPGQVVTVFMTALVDTPEGPKEVRNAFSVVAELWNTPDDHTREMYRRTAIKAVETRISDVVRTVKHLASAGGAGEGPAGDA